MEKRKLEWGIYFLYGSEILYEMFGTEIDKQLFEAIKNCNNEEIVRLVKQGANPNTKITEKRTLHGETEYKTGNALSFLLDRQPQEYFDSRSVPGYGYDDQIWHLKCQIEYAERRGGRGADDLINDMDREIRKIQKKQREAQREIENKNDKIRKENLEEEQKIIATVELLLSMGYGPTVNGGMVALNDNFIKNLKFKNLAAYLTKARLVEQEVTKIMNDNRMFKDHDAEAFCIDKQTEYRNLNVDEEELLAMLHNDSQLNPQLLNL